MHEWCDAVGFGKGKASGDSEQQQPLLSKAEDAPDPQSHKTPDTALTLAKLSAYDTPLLLIAFAAGEFHCMSPNFLRYNRVGISFKNIIQLAAQHEIVSLSRRCRNCVGQRRGSARRRGCRSYDSSQDCRRRPRFTGSRLRLSMPRGAAPARQSKTCVVKWMALTQ